LDGARPPHKPVHAGHRLAFVIAAAIVALYVIGKVVGAFWP
jgi:hypothetical protein